MTTAEKKAALDKLAKFATKYADGRITTATLKYWRSLPISDNIIVSSAKDGYGNLVAAAAAKITTNSDGTKVTDKAIVVVAPNIRRQTHGTQVLGNIVNECRDNNIEFTAAVADDNEACNAMLNAVGLNLIGTQEALRLKGTEEFTQNIYSTKARTSRVTYDVLSDATASELVRF